MKCPRCGKEMVRSFDGDLGKTYECDCGIKPQDIAYTTSDLGQFLNPVCMDWIRE